MFDNAIKNILPQAVKESLRTKRLNKDSLHLLEQMAVGTSHEYMFKGSHLRESAVAKAVNECVNKFEYVDHTNVDNSYEFFHYIIKGSIQASWRETIKNTGVSFPSREELMNKRKSN